MATQRRFFITKDNIYRDKFVIPDKQTAKYMRKVLRLSVGDKITLFDGQGKEFAAEIGSLRNDLVKGKIVGEAETSQNFQPKIQLILAQALPRAGKLDEIVRMNTEVGVAQFILFESDYGVVKSKDFPEAKLERLRRVIKEATRQSEGLTMSEISLAGNFTVAIETPADMKILLHSRVEAEARNLWDLKSNLPKDSKVLLLVGSEGGFSAKELELAQQNQVKIAHLNLPILRTETAGVVASGILLS